MKEVNFEAIKTHVRTQYGDLTGVLQIDGFNGGYLALEELCKDNNVDTNDIFIIGFGLGEHTIDGIGTNDNVHCRILYVNNDDYGNTYDEIESRIKSNGTLRLKQKSFYIKYSSLNKYIKRYDFLVTSDLTKSAEKIEIEEDNE